MKTFEIRVTNTNLTQLPKAKKLSQLINLGKTDEIDIFKKAEIKSVDKIFNANLNGAVNHIKLAIKQSFQWLKDNTWKLCNPIKVKSAGELHNLLCNICSNKSNLKERRTTAQAYRYSTICW